MLQAGGFIDYEESSRDIGRWTLAEIGDLRLLLTETMRSWSIIRIIIKKFYENV
jgi:hypothetical protein